MELGIASNRYPGYREVWESYPGSDEDGIAIALPEGTTSTEVGRDEVREGVDEIVTLHTTPLGGQVGGVEIHQGSKYVYSTLRYLKILRDAPDIIRL